MSYKYLLVPALCFTLLATACSDDDDYDYDRPSPPPVSVGTLQFNWTIDGRTDSAACEAVGATAFGIVVFDQGFFVTQVEAPCDEFETSLELYVDDYVSRVTLVDTNDVAVTRRVIEDYFVISEGAVTRLSVDFPSRPRALVPDAGAMPADAGTIPPAADAGAIEPPADAGAADAGAATP